MRVCSLCLFLCLPGFSAGVRVVQLDLEPEHVGPWIFSQTGGIFLSERSVDCDSIKTGRAVIDNEEKKERIAVRAVGYLVQGTHSSFGINHWHAQVTILWNDMSTSDIELAWRQSTYLRAQKKTTCDIKGPEHPISNHSHIEITIINEKDWDPPLGEEDVSRINEYQYKKEGLGFYLKFDKWKDILDVMFKETESLTFWWYEELQEYQHEITYKDLAEWSAAYVDEFPEYYTTTQNCQVFIGNLHRALTNGKVALETYQGGNVHWAFEKISGQTLLSNFSRPLVLDDARPDNEDDDGDVELQVGSLLERVGSSNKLSKQAKF